MNIVIFDDKIGGHHLEYVHHLYEMALSRPDHRFIFVIPDLFYDVNDKFQWINATNITFDLIPREKVSNKEGSIIHSIRKSATIAKLVNKYCKKHSADIVFMNSIMTIIPASLFYFNSKVKISGIIYQIYLYRDSKSSLLLKMMDRIKYVVLSKKRTFAFVFILNDESSAKKLNSIYKTDKFKYLTDPYISLKEENIDIRRYYNIPDDHKLLIHIGSLERRKGTLVVLDSILKLPQEDRCKYTFFFAGRVDKDIKVEFYEIINAIEDVNVVVKDEFCSYGFFASLCKVADAILLPYLLDSASSGIIGYASQFNTPVIATSTGLIGELVKEYNLGHLLPTVNASSLIYAYYQLDKGLLNKPDNTYCSTHTVDKVNEAIVDILDCNYR